MSFHVFFLWGGGGGGRGGKEGKETPVWCSSRNLVSDKNIF